MSGHPYADLMAKAAEIAKTDKEWWRNFQVKDGSAWLTFSSGDFAFYPNREYRLKPRTIDINGYQVPEPAREKPRIFSELYRVEITGNKARVSIWNDTEIDNRWLERGLIHLTKEAAEAHIAALLSFTQK